jgi:hypothetical protein
MINVPGKHSVKVAKEKVTNGAKRSCPSEACAR